MEISAPDRPCTIDPPLRDLRQARRLGEIKEGRAAVSSVGPADMDLVAANRRIRQDPENGAGGYTRSSFHLSEPFFRLQDSLSTHKAQAWDRSAAAFHPLGIADPLPQDLVSPADPGDPPTLAQIAPDRFLPARLEQGGEIREGLLGPGKD